MKNITKLPNAESCGQCCDKCGLKALFCYTRDDGYYSKDKKYITCPCCGEGDLVGLSRYYEPGTTQYDKCDFLHKSEYNEDVRNKYKYCHNCNIMYQIGCVHSYCHSIRDVYNCHFIKKWQNKLTNVVYEGMPHFDNEDDWFNNAANVEVLEMCCPHQNLKCRKSPFNFNQYPFTSKKKCELCEYIEPVIPFPFIKNITNLSDAQRCVNCKIRGFFCYTPRGADCNTCPCCGDEDVVRRFIGNEQDPKYTFLYDDEYENDVRYKYCFCDRCNIMYEVGCAHSNDGCTSNVYNCHFIKKWKNKVTNEEYEGMPQFVNETDWFNNANNVEVLEMFCPHKNNECTKSTYKINHKHNICELCL